ncbi:MAG: CDP-glycerol glycerophosphotransferase family protein [Pirellulales bacterium]
MGRVWSKILVLARFARRQPLRAWLAVFPAIIDNCRALLRRRRGRRLVVLYVDGPGYVPIVEPVIDELSRRPAASRIELWLATRPEQVASLTQHIQNWPLAPARILTSWRLAALLTFDLFLTTHQSGVAPLSGRGPKICLFHGLPNKGGTFPPDQWLYLNGVFLLGPLQRELFEAFSALQPGRKWLVRDVGYPKSDRLVRREYDRRATLERLRLDASRPMVLYAPSWEEGASLRTRGCEVIESLCALENVQVVVKLHPMSYYSPTEYRATGGVDWVAKLRRFEGRSGFRHVPQADVAELVSAADVVVTDVSSVSFEAILADRPVVFVDCAEFFDRVAPAMYGTAPAVLRTELAFNSGRDAGRVVQDLNELRGAVLDYLANPALESNEREQVRDRLLYHPGRAAEVSARTICELVEGSTGG